MHNQVSAISFLIKEGVDINSADQISGATPLIAAILNGSSDVMTALNDNGCDMAR